MRIRAICSTGLIAILASCIHEGRAPRVAPTAKLVPRSDENTPRTAAPFAIVFSGPTGALARREDALVTVLFNRAMRALEDAETANLPAATIKSRDGREIAGHFRWVGTRGLLFEPASGVLPAATDIEVIIPAGTRAVDGSALAHEHRFAFDTPRPQVLQAPFKGRSDVTANAVLRLEFNQRIDPAEAAKQLKLLVRGKPGAVARAVPITAKRPSGALPADRADRFVEIVASEKLPLDSHVELVIPKGFRASEGPLGTQSEQILAARTFGPLRLADIQCNKQELGRCRAKQEIAVVLTNPVARKDLLAHLSVEGGEPAKLLVAKTPVAASTVHVVVAQPVAGKRYKVRIRKGLRDVFGQVLEKEIVVAVDTEAPFVGGSPVTSAAQGPATDDGPAGGAAFAPPAGVPVRPKLDFQASIGLRGHVVEAAANDGVKSHKVPVGVVNVPTVGLWSGALGDGDVVRWLASPSHDLAPTGVPWAWDWFTPGVAENVRAVRTLNLDTILGGGKKGAALLALSVPGQSMPYNSALVTVTNLAVAARMGSGGGLVWVTRLSNGKPVADANVRIVRLHPKKPALAEAFSGTTDAEGMLTVPGESFDPLEKTQGNPKDAIAIVRSGDDWTFARIERSRAGALSWWDVDLTGHASYRALLFTERGVYRPGETIKLAGVVRKGTAKGLEAPAGKEIKLRISDGEGNELLTTRAKIDAFGTFAVDVPISKTAKFGTGSISGELATSEAIASTTFLLAAYKASAFKIAVDSAQPAQIHGDDAPFTVSGGYLYGAAMGGASVHAEVTRAPVAFTPPKTEAFLFGDGEPTGYIAAHVLGLDGTLDAQGRFATRVKLALPGQTTPERVTFEAEVQDATQQTVAKSASVLVHPAEIYLGLERSGSRFLNMPGGSPDGLEVRPSVAAFEPSGARRAGVTVTFELVARKWTSSIAEQPDGSSLTSSKPKDELIATCTAVTTTAASCPLTVKEPGYYFVRARARDPRNNESRVATSLWVVSEQADPKNAAAVAKTDLKVVQLEADKPVYKPGEKAKILVHNPFPTSKETTALVTIERGGVLEKQLVTLRGAMPVVEIPVKSEWFPNAFISIDVVRGRIKAPPLKGLDLGGPEFRVGTTEIRVDPESHRLKVAITPSKTKLAPGEAFDADVAVTDVNGKPAKTSVTFYAVDDGVLMLTGYRTPDPLPPFAERLRLGVFGFDTREHLAHVLPMRAGDKVPILGWDFPARDGWEKGSEYGDGEGASNTPRMDFRATAFFEAGRITGDDGRTRFRVKLPDNLTSFRLMAVAAAGDDRFGFGESNITSSKKLMIRPALPRALRVGDAFDAAVVLTSKELPTSAVSVTVVAKGLTVDGPTSFNVQVAPGQQVPVRFKMRATAPGAASIEVRATGGNTTDHVVLARTVALPTSARSVAAYGETSSASAIELGGLDGMRPDQGGLEVKLANSALVGLDTSFEHLVEYPYGCTEQMVSRALPLLSLRDLAKHAAFRMPARTDAVIDESIAKVLAHQTGSGGFGYWVGEQPVPWLSAYTALVLEEAGKKGYAVPRDARDRAVSYLRAQLPISLRAAEQDEGKPGADLGADEDTAIEDQAPWIMTPALLAEDLRGVHFATAAMIADTLASSGAPDPGSMNRLYDARAKKPLFAKAFLLHAMAAAKMTAVQLETLSRELESRLVVEANSATAMPEGPVYAPMLDSGTRTAALVLRALLAVNPKHPLAPRLARGLLSARADGAWRSTQENVWALVALDAYRTAQEPVTASFDARAFFGDTELGHSTFRPGEGAHQQSFFVPAAKLGKGGPLSVSLSGGDGQGKLFWSAQLRYVTSALPTRALDNGLFLEKRVRSLPPGALEKALGSLPTSTTNKAKLGELLLVDLLFETAEARDQLVIDDPLPAGVEPLDVNLETVGAAKSQDVGNGTFLAHATAKRPNPSFVHATVHREHHDDRVLTFLGRVEPGIYHFRYVARATSAGTFVVPPTTAHAMYAPEINGRTAAASFTIERP